MTSKAICAAYMLALSVLMLTHYLYMHVTGRTPKFWDGFFAYFYVAYAVYGTLYLSDLSV